MSYGNPYNNAPGAEAGYGGGGAEQHEMHNYNSPNVYAQEAYGNPYAQDDNVAQNPYGQQQQSSSPYGAAAPAASYGGYGAQATGYGGDGTTPTTQTGGDAFFSKVSEADEQLRQMDEDIYRIRQKQTQTLTSTDLVREQQELNAMIEQFNHKCRQFRDRLQVLVNEAGTTNAAKRQQVDRLRNAFKERNRTLQEQEQEYRSQMKQDMKRQFLVANPAATDLEAEQAVDSGDFSQGGVFQQALMSNRTGQARAVLGNVQARHNEILKIEQQMTELAQLFQDLDTMVIQQDPVIQRMEEDTEQTNVHINQGTKEIDKGIVHARRTRRNKWICLGIVVLICIIIAVGVGVGVTATKK